MIDDVELFDLLRLAYVLPWETVAETISVRGYGIVLTSIHT